MTRAGVAARSAPEPSAGLAGGPEPTLADVARAAGVSIATASRAISGRGPVAQPTRDRVLSAARRLEFQPSAVGRSLRTRTSGLIGFVVPDIGSAFYASALKGAQHRLALGGYQLALMDTDERPEREAAALRALAAQGVDGIIVCSTGLDGEAIADVRRRRGIPVVFFDNLGPGTGDGAVALANEQGVGLLVEHLAAVHGHRRIAFVGGLETETSGAERLAGFRLAVAARALDLDPALVRAGDWTTAAGARETHALLDLADRPDAIVYADALMALGGLAVLRERGVAVPADLAIVSFDDSDAGPLLDPPITALARRDRTIGDLAASLILRVLQGEAADPVEVRLPMELVVRRSCGCGSGPGSGS
ncbi:MAG TPA: LacI family DNA-binding transcriptional regulator [Candidatus Limnocylindrales bacterium]|nr:LacI family DNA-binding transcriptional regulator [Candidatus Limnocylindrales bacterium]